MTYKKNIGGLDEGVDDGGASLAGCAQDGHLDHLLLLHDARDSKCNAQVGLSLVCRFPSNSIGLIALGNVEFNNKLPQLCQGVRFQFIHFILALISKLQWALPSGPAVIMTLQVATTSPPPSSN